MVVFALIVFLWVSTPLFLTGGATPCKTVEEELRWSSIVVPAMIFINRKIAGLHSDFPSNVPPGRSAPASLPRFSGSSERPPSRCSAHY
jgi:hypothetical protein